VVGGVRAEVSGAVPAAVGAQTRMAVSGAVPVVAVSRAAGAKEAAAAAAAVDEGPAAADALADGAVRAAGVPRDRLPLADPVPSSAWCRLYK